MMITYYDKLDKIVEAKNAMADFINNYDGKEDALRAISKYAWSIRHQDYALFRAIMAVYQTARITNDLGWVYNFYMPSNDDACEWMCANSRKYARQDERYRKERGI